MASPPSRLIARTFTLRSPGQTLHTEIALDALNMAIERRRPAAGLIHHSYRDIQYAAEAHRSALAHAGISPSMSRKGDSRALKGVAVEPRQIAPQRLIEPLRLHAEYPCEVFIQRHTLAPHGVGPARRPVRKNHHGLRR